MRDFDFQLFMVCCSVERFWLEPLGIPAVACEGCAGKPWSFVDTRFEAFEEAEHLQVLRLSMHLQLSKCKAWALLELGAMQVRGLMLSTIQGFRLSTQEVAQGRNQKVPNQTCFGFLNRNCKLPEML